MFWLVMNWQFTEHGLFFASLFPQKKKFVGGAMPAAEEDPAALCGAACPDVVLTDARSCRLARAPCARRPCQPSPPPPCVSRLTRGPVHRTGELTKLSEIMQDRKEGCVLEWYGHHCGPCAASGEIVQRQPRRTACRFARALARFAEGIRAVLQHLMFPQH